VATNGRTEPRDWTPVHAERAGRLSAVLVQRGQLVAEGGALATLADPEAQAALAAAEARQEQARADVSTLAQGGRASELAQIDGALARLKGERETAQRDAAALDRLVAKQAATRQELDTAKSRLADIDTQIRTETARRASLAPAGELSAARARLREAEKAVEQARKRVAQATLRAPVAGSIYEMELKTGAWVNDGDLVAKIGDTARLRVIIYVDEPDLGRIHPGQSVTLSWDARPGVEWHAVVDEVPSEVISLGTRQVGEVRTTVDVPRRDLVPGANINARIQAQVASSTLAIPKSALRRENGHLGVFALVNGRVAWRDVKIGVSSETRAEVLDGLKDGDSVALPVERVLTSGQEVRPVY
jgi:multidrug resistance efflux pump